jgi:hypothetical protein
MTSDEPQSPFLRAFAEAEAAGTPPPAELSRDRLADRLVDRFNRGEPATGEAAIGRSAETATRPEWRAWLLCRALVRRAGTLHVGTRFRRREPRLDKTRPR